MLVRSGNESNPIYVEVFSKEKLSEEKINDFLSNFVSSEESHNKKMIGEFEGTILVYDKNKKIQEGLTYNKKYEQPGKASISINQNNGRVEPDPEDCWYIVLTTTYTQYFPDGTSYTWSESTIIGSYCNNTGETGGGGVYNECNATMSALINDGSVANDLQNISTVHESPTTRTKNYVWTFFKSNGNFPTVWRFDSHETGVHVKTNNVWKWQSLQHNSISKIGLMMGGNVECAVNGSTPTLGQYWAIMALNFNITYSIVCQNFPISSSHNFASSKIFDVNE